MSSSLLAPRPYKTPTPSSEADGLDVAAEEEEPNAMAVEEPATASAVAEPEFERFFLWRPAEDASEDCKFPPIEVDPILARVLRPHQREGVQFMFDCGTSQRRAIKAALSQTYFVLTPCLNCCF